MKEDSAITLEKLEIEAEHLRKKIFIYETLQSEKEIKQKKTRGPFKNGRELISSFPLYVKQRV